MRNYKNLPDPIEEPEQFNKHLRDNNQVAMKASYWIVIKNSQIKDQLVVFHKYSVSHLHNISDASPAD